MTEPRISIVIPAYNEAGYLPRLFATLNAARERYRHDPQLIEVILSDNGSTDDTVQLALDAGCHVVHATPRVIGAVRNVGGKAARGSLLAFIDADTQVHADTFNAIEDCFASQRYIVAVSGALPERRSLGIDLTWLVMGLITVVATYGIPRTRAHCAPTGVVCCRREDWSTIGGYSERLRFAEDVLLLLELKRLGLRKRQWSGWLRDAPAIFSMRKFDEHGDWHYLWFPFRLIANLFAPTYVDRWADRYWYGRQRDRVPKP